MKKILQISLLTLTVIGLVTLTGFIVNKNMYSKIADVKVNIYRNTNNGFINKHEIIEKINTIDSIVNVDIKKIKTNEIEKIIARNPYVDKVDSYITINGNLLINIKEKQPIIRIYNNTGSSCYIDDNGDFFQSKIGYAPRVIIANGYINKKLTTITGNINDSIYNNSVYRKLYELTQLINNNKLLKAQINQIYVNSKGNFDLIPELGNHLIRFGSFDNVKNKIRNLDAYYHKYLKSSTWDSYKIINLTYKNQIVCTKK